MDRRQEHESDRPPQNSFRLKIHVTNKQRDLPLSAKSVRSVVSCVLKFLNASCDEVAVYLISTPAISQLHDEFFQDPTTTDCISFPLGGAHLGEIFVCPATAMAYAKKKGLNPYEETALYIVHGLLHLLGYDDMTPKDKRVMRKKEKSCMAHLNTVGVNLDTAR